jgi:antitoxin (DNA-binding transcriptional repressor) of toxin-antitoxin stability system
VQGECIVGLAGAPVNDPFGDGHNPKWEAPLEKSKQKRHGFTDLNKNEVDNTRGLLNPWNPWRFFGPGFISYFIEIRYQVRYSFDMKKVSMYELKNDLAAIIAEAAAGMDVLVTRHNKPVARLTRPAAGSVHIGSRFGNADLKPAVRGKTGGRYLEILRQDRRSGRE